MKKFIFLILAIFIWQYSYAQGTVEPDENEIDMEAFKKWIREKRMITFKELG